MRAEKQPGFFYTRDRALFLDMMNSASYFLEQRLKQQEALGLTRSLKTGLEALTDFASNDYLGLSRSADLSDRIHREYHENGLRNGATGSRLLTGNSSYTMAVEDQLADLFDAEAVLVFNSGYTANMAVLSSIPGKDDTIIYDELAHACIKDGARLSLAKRFNFRHNDLDDLESKMKKAVGRIYIAVESVYSMDGDICPLDELTGLAAKYNAAIVLDEAHSTGVMGKNGSGYAVETGVHDTIFARIYTFGKAMGIHGACVAGSKLLREYLINFARPFIYTTALSPHSIAAIKCAFEYLKDQPSLQTAFRENVFLFNSLAAKISAHPPFATPIKTVVVPGNYKVRQMAEFIQSKGFDVRPILSPTVPKGMERLRICIHSFNTKDDVRELSNALEEGLKNIM